MQLSFGSGNAAAILDLASCQVEMYNEPGLEGNTFHARFGGRQYYASLSGMSGAGWIPDRPDIRPVGVLRADVSRPAVPSRAEALSGVRLVVLTKHLQRDQRLPLLVIRDREVAVVYPQQLREALLGTLELEQTQKVTLTSWVKLSNERMYERKLDIQVAWSGHKPRRWGKLSLRRVLELLFWNELFQKEASAVYRRSYEPFWEDLGLHRSEADGRLYRSVGGILRHPVEETVEAVEAETGQKLLSLGEDSDILVRVDNDPETGEFRLRHSAETDWKSSRSGVRPLRLDMAQALEIFASASLPPRVAVELAELQAPTPIVARSTSDESSREIMPDWERELLGLDPVVGEAPVAES